MKQAVTALNFVVRLCGLALIVLGALFWSGHALWLVQVHMLLGLILVLALWALAAIALARKAVFGRAVAAIVWGAITLVFGMAQMQLLPGSAHWVIQVLHLLVGLAAIGMGESLARSLRALAP